MVYVLRQVALSVSDIEQSIAFYSDLMGMKKTLDLEAFDDRIGRVIGIPGAKCRIVHLAVKEDSEAVLELFQYCEPAGQNKAKDMRQCDHGFTHIGFDVTDFPKHLEQLKKRNVELLGDPIEFRPGVHIVYFRGPDGEVCEFRQIEQGD